MHKLTGLGLSDSISWWILDFLSDCSPRVKVGTHISTALSLSTRSPQGCVLSPLLFTLYTHDCSPSHPSNTIIKFAEHTTIVGLISGGDESEVMRWDEVEGLSGWCRDLVLNTAQTKEVVVDYRVRFRVRQTFSPCSSAGIVLRGWLTLSCSASPSRKTSPGAHNSGWEEVSAETVFSQTPQETKTLWEAAGNLSLLCCAF